MLLSSMFNIMCREACTYVIPEWVEIRKVTTKADYSAYSCIYSDAFGGKVRFKVSLLNPPKQQHRYIWLYKGECIGIYALRETEENQVLLSNFAVVSTMRGKGFSRVLLASAVTEASKLGCKEIVLKVTTTNVIALNLYHKLNFKFYKVDSIK